MKANELRIGNLIGLPITIKGVDIYELKPFIIEYYSIIDSIVGVKLDEHQLIKFGFVKQKLNTQKLYSIKCKKSNIWFSVHECSDYEDPNELTVKEVKTWWSFQGNNHDVKLKTVHQLQNLYFALTQTELELK